MLGRSADAGRGCQSGVEPGAVAAGLLIAAIALSRGRPWPYRNTEGVPRAAAATLTPGAS